MQQAEKLKIADALTELGHFLASVAREEQPGPRTPAALRSAWASLRTAVETAGQRNPWFIRPFIDNALQAWADALKREQVEQWLEGYDLASEPIARTIGVVMAGNLPMVGFHDILCVLASGHRLLAKLSAEDNVLIPSLVEALEAIWEGVSGKIRLTDGPIGKADAYIATGSNNTARYFEYYFAKYPSIIRRNRNGIAVLDGYESDGQLKALARDILLYFGLGCRNVSKVYYPEGFDPHKILEACGEFAFLADHSKYRNNYDYQKSIFLVNRTDFHDNGFLLARESVPFASPVSVLHLEKYHDLGKAIAGLEQHSGDIQCIVSGCREIKGSVRFGESQRPGLSDYADQVDTMEFLIKLGRN